MSLIIRAKQLYIALIFGFCMAILEAFGILLLSLLLGSFTQQFDIGNFKLLAFSPFLVEYILELSKSQFQIIICISLVVRYLMSIVFQYTILSLIYNVRFSISKKVLHGYSQKSVMGKIDSQNQGEFIRNYIQGVDHIADNFLVSAISIAKELATIILLVIFIIISVKLVLWNIAPFIIFFLFIAYVCSKSIKKLGVDIRDLSLVIYNKAIDFSRMANFLSFSNKTDIFIEDLNFSRSKQINTLKLYGSLQLSLQPIIELMLILGVLFSVYMSSSIESNIIELNLLLVAGIRLIPSGSRLAAGINSINYSLPYINSMFKIINNTGNNFKGYIKKSSNDKFEMMLPEFKYGANVILKSQTKLEFNKTDIIKLDGVSGSGKSSLLNFVASQSVMGNVKIGYIEQFPDFFEGTIYDNLTLKDDNISKKEVLDLVNILSLKESFQCSNEKILEIIVSDNAKSLSGGQKKKLALVREKLKNPDLLLLDELNAGLDQKNRIIVANFIKTFFKEGTIIYTSHSDEKFNDTDKLFKLENNELREVK